MNRILFLALIEGAMVLATELLGGSVIIPFYGNGLEVWTYVLGITMLALAAGYYLGSYVSRFWSVAKWITLLFPLLAIFFFQVPAIAHASFEEAVSENFHSTIFWGVFPVLFFPLCICGMISSLLICLAAEQGERVAVSSGRIYGYSTLSGVFTALFIGLFALENIDNTFLFFLFSLLAISSVLALHSGVGTYLKWGGSSVALLIVFLSYLSVSAEAGAEEVPNTKTLYKSRGILGEIKVVDDLSSGTRMFYVNNALQSTLGKDKFASLPYVKYIGFFLSHRKPGEKLLLAGVGGGNLVRDLQPLGFNTDVVELDERVLYAAETYFETDFSKCRVFIDDARHYINTTDEKYDIVILDLSLGEIIPSNVYTIEAFEKINAMLNENGIVVLHLFSSEKGESRKSIHSLGKTIEASGLKCYLFNNEHDPTLPSPYIFVASKKEMDFTKMNYANYGMSGSRIFPSPDGDVRPMKYVEGEILTDDKPSLEIYQRDIVSFFRQSYIRDFYRFLMRKK